MDEKFAFTFLCVYILFEVCKFIVRKFMPYITNKYNNGDKTLAIVYFLVFTIGILALSTTCISQLWFYIHRA